MKKWLLLGFALLFCVDARAERKPYKVLVTPEKGLGQYGKVAVGNFDTRAFLEKLKEKNASNYESYAELTPKINQLVRNYVVEAMNSRTVELKGAGLVVSAKLLNYRTGDAGARATGAFFSSGGGGSRMGNGFLDYEITLSSAGKIVAMFNVHSDIKANKEGAYRAIGSYINWFLQDFEK